MHIIFKAPRYIASREFKDLYLKSEVRFVKTREQIQGTDSVQQSIVAKSQAEKYWSRHEWKRPDKAGLLSKHPLSRQPLWQEILRTVGLPVLGGEATLDYHYSTVQERWLDYLELLSFWQLKRYFNFNKMARPSSDF